MNEEEYWRALRTALRNLYDHAALRRNPLAPMFAASAPGRGLQEILLEAVQTLSPARGSAVQSDARRTHQILQHRYVEQFSQGEVADSLALSERQLRRQEQLAIRTLGEALRVRYALPVVLGVATDPANVQGAPEDDASETATETTIETAIEPAIEPEIDAIDEAGGETGVEAAGAPERYQEEIERLHQETPLEVLDVVAMLEGVVETLQPLLQGLSLRVEFELAQAVPNVSVNAVALRQALMIALSALARATTGDRIAIDARAGDGTLRLALGARSTAQATPFAGGESLSMAQRLLAVSGGEMSASAEDGLLTLLLELPTLRTLTILVIDDNQDSLLLCQRYLTGTPYQPVLTRDPLEGLALAERIAPQIILLDVMMPGMDGWETLARLRRHPATETIPVIIFTILPEESLATALGAAGFLRKPFTREELLAAIRTAIRTAATS